MKKQLSEKEKIEIKKLNENGCTDSDIIYFCENKKISQRAAFHYIAELNAPPQCQGCKNIGMLPSMPPCTRCKRIHQRDCFEPETTQLTAIAKRDVPMNKEEILLELLADTIPSDPNEFNSETGYGEPQHWMTLHYDRSLEIVYEETGDNNRYYSWRVHCNEKEFDNDNFHSTMGIIDQNNSDDLNFDTRTEMLNWAITVALTKPRS